MPPGTRLHRPPRSTQPPALSSRCARARLAGSTLAACDRRRFAIPRPPSSRSETVTDSPRTGFALVLSILAVVLVGALIIATHVAMTLEHTVSSAATRRQRAFAASEL